MMQNDESPYSPIIVEDETLRHGFTQIPNALLRMQAVTPGAKLTYMVLLSYAWQAGSCFPGQEKLSVDMGVSRRSVVTYLQQLEDAHLLQIRRRGLGKTNIYFLPRFPQATEPSEPRAPRSAKSAHQEVQKTTHQEVQNLHIEKDSDQENSEKENSVSLSKGAHAQELTQEIVDNSDQTTDPEKRRRPTGLRSTRADPKPKRSSSSTSPLHTIGDPTGGERQTEGAGERTTRSPWRESGDRAVQQESRAASQPTALRDLLAGAEARIDASPSRSPRTARSGLRGTKGQDHYDPAEESRPGGAAGPIQRTPAIFRRRTAKSAYISTVIEELSVKLHDPDHSRANITRALRLWEASGLDEQTFVNALYEVSSITRQQGTVKKRVAGGGGLINRMPYFFAVLEDHLGLKEHAERRAAP